MVFTEDIHLRSQGVADLLVVGPGDQDGGANFGMAKRPADRLSPALAELGSAIEEALDATSDAASDAVVETLEA